MVIPTLAAEVVNELPLPTYVYGVVATLVLLLVLQVVRGIGKSRPHS